MAVSVSAESTVPTVPQYPRLLRRVRAALIDSVVFVLLFFLWQLSLAFVSDDAATAWKITPFIVALLLAEPGLVAWTGGTIGHHVMGLRVRDARRDRKIGIVRATLRAALRIYLGWASLMFVLVTRKHQAIHDYVLSTVVVLQRPMFLPESERFTERATPDGMETSGWRRAGMILLYCVVTVVPVSVAGGLVMTDACVNYDQCTPSEEAAVMALGIGWLAAIAAMLVLGWRGLLPGCRRRPGRRAAEADPGGA